MLTQFSLRTTSFKIATQVLSAEQPTCFSSLMSYHHSSRLLRSTGQPVETHKNWIRPSCSSTNLEPNTSCH